MLKIAEYNTITGEKIDLKELEKYGFINSDDESCLILMFDKYEGVVVSKSTKRTTIFMSGKDIVSDIVMANIYDLIKDGLVEKVEE